MSLWVLIVVLVALAVLAYFLKRAAWMDAWIKTLIYIVIVVVAVVLVLNAFGLIDVIRGVKVPRVQAWSAEAIL